MLCFEAEMLSYKMQRSVKLAPCLQLGGESEGYPAYKSKAGNLGSSIEGYCPGSQVTWKLSNPPGGLF